MLWNFCRARAGTPLGWGSSVLLGLLGLLLMLAGSTLLVHAHDGQSTHLHLLMHADAERSAETNRHAHEACAGTESGESGPVVCAAVDGEHRVLLSLPIWEVPRDRSAGALPALGPWHWEALQGSATAVTAPIPLAPRGPPFRSRQAGSGSQRILRSSHALRI